jgi:hypothetical protein
MIARLQIIVPSSRRGSNRNPAVKVLRLTPGSSNSIEIADDNASDTVQFGPPEWHRSRSIASRQEDH